MSHKYVKRILPEEKEIFEQQKTNHPDLDIWEYTHRLRFFRDNITRAENRYYGWAINIRATQCMQQAEKQNWKCVISKRDLEFTRGGTEWRGNWCNPNSATIDRINSEFGYEVDNIQILTHYANQWKSNFSNQELKELSEGFLSR
jgi:hypothetical protein